MTGPLAYPLDWPVQRPRTSIHARKRAVFRMKGDRQSFSGALTIAAALGRLSRQLKASQARKIIVSSNLELRQDGLPRSGQGDPLDNGVAVYFEIERKSICVSCDRWDRSADNIAAIAKHVEATRGMARWGCASLSTLYAGLLALPAPGQTSATVRHWRDVLGVHSGPLTREDVELAYRRRAAERHPDRGGSQSAMSELNIARGIALDELHANEASERARA